MNRVQDAQETFLCHCPTTIIIYQQVYKHSIPQTVCFVTLVRDESGHGDLSVPQLQRPHTQSDHLSRVACILCGGLPVSLMQRRTYASHVQIRLFAAHIWKIDRLAFALVSRSGRWEVVPLLRACRGTVWLWLQVLDWPFAASERCNQPLHLLLRSAPSTRPRTH